MMFNISLGKMQRKMSRKARNTETEAEKRSAVRVRVIRDVAVIFVCLVILIGFAGSRNVITPEPEYAFVGGTTRDVPVYLIGIPLEGERADGGAPDETAEEGSGEEVEEDNGQPNPVLNAFSDLFNNINNVREDIEKRGKRIQRVNKVLLRKLTKL